MKKYFTLIVLVTTVFILSNCHTARKAMKEIPKLTFETNLKLVIAGNCTPCHIPAKGGNKKPFDNYENVKTNIDEMIRRIELAPAEKGFMPFKRAKLSDSTVAIFKQWRTDGLLEK